MRNYFKGNTSARRRRMAKINKKFKAHQRSWILKRLVRANDWYRKNKRSK